MFPAFLPSNSKFWSIHASNIFATVHIVRHSRTPKWTVQVWRTPKQRFFWFYREVLLEHCACWRCFSISIAWNWDGLGMIRKSVGVRACTRPQCGPIAFIKSKRFKKFQKLDSVHMFPAFLPSNSKFWSIHASNIFATVHIVRHSRTPKWTVQVWRTPKQRFFWFYREVLLEHCACWRCFSIIVETRYLYKMAVSGRLLKFTRGSLRYKIMVGSPPKNTAHNLWESCHQNEVTQSWIL